MISLHTSVQQILPEVLPENKTLDFETSRSSETSV